MSKNLDIMVKHLTRVEGHGNIVVNMKDGVLEKAQLDIVEAPRYFEAMLKGRSFHEADMWYLLSWTPNDIIKSN